LLLLNHLQNQIDVRQRWKIGNQQRRFHHQLNVESFNGEMAIRCQPNHLACVKCDRLFWMTRWPNPSLAFEYHELAGCSIKDCRAATDRSRHRRRTHFHFRRAGRHLNEHGTALQLQFARVWFKAEYGI